MSIAMGAPARAARASVRAPAPRSARVAVAVVEKRRLAYLHSLAGRRPSSSSSSSSSAHQTRAALNGDSASVAKDDTPSLRDEDEYAGVVLHDDAPVPRLERFVNSLVINAAVLIIDKLYEGRDYSRFYALETVARVPYFSFLSVLHLYETLGFWRRADYLKVHFAQTMNEFHHLLIMESLGGDDKFRDRFFAQHMAVGYYGIACLMYLVSPRMAYNLSEQVEEHAYHTYDVFLRENEERLKRQSPPPIAVHYYQEGDLFLFDEFQTGAVTGVARGADKRRPRIDSLYDVFVNVRNDEAEHMKTMQFCQLPGTILRAPSEAAACSVVFNKATSDSEPDRYTTECVEEYATMEKTCEGLLDCLISNDSYQRERGGDAAAAGGGDARDAEESGENNVVAKMESGEGEGEGEVGEKQEEMPSPR